MTNEMLELADEIEKFVCIEARQGIGALCARNAEKIVAALRSTAAAQAEVLDLQREKVELVKALELAEDVLSRAPMSTSILPNGMHPQGVIGQIRAALALVKP